MPFCGTPGIFSFLGFLLRPNMARPYSPVSGGHPSVGTRREGSPPSAQPDLAMSLGIADRVHRPLTDGRALGDLQALLPRLRTGVADLDHGHRDAGYVLRGGRENTPC